jgi:hypothetical protein
MNTIINKFEKDTIRHIMDDVKESFKTIGTKYGISFVPGKISFSNDLFRTKIECVINNQNIDANRVLFNRNCAAFGFTLEDYERTFTFADKVYKIVGFNVKSHKYNVIVECEGKKFKFQSSLVKDCLHSDLVKDC